MKEFDFKPILQGAKIVLRPLVQDDFEALYSAVCDPLIWATHPQKDRYKKVVFQSYFKDAITSDAALVAQNLTTGDVIGSSRFHGYSQRRSEIEIGWSFLTRAYWGGQYNSEMKHLMMNHAFKYVNHIVFVIGVENVRSQRAIEKFSVSQQIFDHPRINVENVAYRISKEEFINSNI